LKKWLTTLIENSWLLFNTRPKSVRCLKMWKKLKKSLSICLTKGTLTICSIAKLKVMKLLKSKLLCQGCTLWFNMSLFLWEKSLIFKTSKLMKLGKANKPKLCNCLLRLKVWRGRQCGILRLDWVVWVVELMTFCRQVRLIIHLVGNRIIGKGLHLL